MVTTLIKIALRNLLRHKQHSLINVLGLSVAIAATLIVFLVIQYETGYNKYLTNYDRLFQIVTMESSEAGVSASTAVPFPALAFLQKDQPDVTFGETMVEFGIQITVRPWQAGLRENKFIESLPVYFMDSALVRMLDISMLAGRADALQDPLTVLISQRNAEKYFGDWTQALGKQININNTERDLTIGGVFADIPNRSDLPTDILASYALWKAANPAGWPLDDWGALSSNHQVYGLIPSNKSKQEIDNRLATFYNRYDASDESQKRSAASRMAAAWHFDETIGNNGSHVTSKRSLYTLGFIGLLVILMACINFINLSTALASTRHKEMGMKKVMGSSMGQIRWQIMLETGFIVTAAIITGIALTALALPYVKNIMIVQHELSLFSSGSILFLIILLFTCTAISGWYPAIIVSSITPAVTLKRSLHQPRGNKVSLRRMLVVMQFAFSQILIMATLITIAQMQLVRHADKGFSAENLLIVNVPTDSASLAKTPSFKQALQARADVKQVSMAFDAPSSYNSWNSGFALDNNIDQPYAINLKFADADYFDTYGLHFAAGESYRPADTSRSYVVNETFVKKAGYTNPEDILGKTMRVGGGRHFPIVGVVKDFTPQSLKTSIPPIVITANARRYGTAGIKLLSNNLQKSRDELEALWDQFFPAYAFDAGFLDERIENYYQQDTRLTKMYQWYAILAILISCLGLYGLVSFMIVQKTKEVGVRKVLGATVADILLIFSREYTLLILIAFVFAAPTAWWLMQQWLQDFTYRIEVGPTIFLTAIVASILIAWLTVGYQSVRAALAAPANSLRTE